MERYTELQHCMAVLLESLLHLLLTSGVLSATMSLSLFLQGSKPNLRGWGRKGWLRVQP